LHAASATDPAVSLGAQAPDPLSGRAPHYRLRGALQWREFEGEWVVRAEPSGSLFQLDPLSAAVLGLLEGCPQGRSALLASLVAATSTTSTSAAAAGTPGEFGSTQPGVGQAPPRPEGATAAPALARALDDTLARLVADDLVAAPARS